MATTSVPGNPADALDRELRFAVLAAHYARRRERIHALAPCDISVCPSVPLTPRELDRLSLQLIDLGLLASPSIDRWLGRTRRVRARITSAGIDAVEDRIAAEAALAPDPPQSAKPRLLTEWPTVLFGLLASIAFALTIRWLKGPEVGAGRYCDLIGNSLILMGVAWTVNGVRLSGEDLAQLEGEEAGSAAHRPALVARLFRSASSYASAGLVWIVIGTGLIFVKIMWVEPRQEAKGAVEDGPSTSEPSVLAPVIEFHLQLPPPPCAAFGSVTLLPCTADAVGLRP